LLTNIHRTDLIPAIDFMCTTVCWGPRRSWGPSPNPT